MDLPPWDDGPAAAPQRPRRGLGQLLRSAMAGTAGGALDLAIGLLLVELLHVLPLAATVASAVAGACLNFGINRSWAFRSRGPLARQGGHYALATGVWVALSAVSVHLFMGLARVPFIVARVVADVVVFLGWGYPASRWIFAPRRV